MCLYLKVGDYDETDTIRNSDLGQGGHYRPAEGGMVEVCSLSLQGNNREEQFSGTNLGPAQRGSGRPAGRRKRSNIDFEALEKVLSKYPCTPMINITRTEPWLIDPTLKYVREDDRDLLTVIDMLMAKVNTWNYYDFKHMYMSHQCTPLFSSTMLDTGMMYYSVEDSLDVLVRFLEYQFETEDAIVDFMTNVFNVCERRIPKLNTICVVSPPSAGKNFFFDMILAFYWTKGQMGNPNKNNLFAYAECVNKRIVLWNEPNYESSEVEMLKMVLGGDTYTVRVKYKNDIAVNRTPVIVLSNNMVNFMVDPAFADRIKVYTWNTCPMLKDCTLKPHPLAYIELVNKYNIS